MATLGQELKKKREEKGISLHQIATNTLIGIRFLEALEADDYSILPGGVFNRAFVRKFAKQVGMEEAVALRLYEEQLHAQGGEEDRKFEMGVENWDAPPTSGNGLLISLVALVVLSVGAWLAYTYFYSPRSQSVATDEAPLVAATPERTQTPAETPTPTPTPVVEGLVLKVETLDKPCWIKIVRDTEPAQESTQQPGQITEFLARERLVVNLGNLPTLRITINGRPIDQSKVVKSPRSVVVTNLILTRDNYINYVQ